MDHETLALTSWLCPTAPHLSVAKALKRGVRGWGWGVLPQMMACPKVRSSNS